MGYIMDKASEFDRLEEMATIRPMDPRPELEDLTVPEGGAALDVGCGSGLVVRLLARHFPGSRITGCDVSPLRVDQAREASVGFENATFQVEDVRHLSFAPASFDLVHCRFVMEHVTAADREQATRELYRCLKPGGTLRIACTDGPCLNIYPAPPLVAELVSALRILPGLDLEAGRKVPPLVAALGVEALQIRVESDPYMDKGCHQVMLTALHGVRPVVAKIVGSEERTGAMIQAYEETLRLPGTTALTSKFVITARKPARAG
jgi:ubiquinone/menaquinone biosynthesis C-methylase UbiE